MNRDRLKIGNTHLNPGGYQNGYIKLGGKFWKSQSSKKVRHSFCMDGNHCRKT